MRLSIASIPYFWPRERVIKFYHDARHWPVDVFYLGETVCSKRRELRLGDWLEVAGMLTEAGKEVVLSSLALIEAESELSALRRIVGNDRFRIEANDMSAVQLCRQKRVSFVGGQSLNVYNARTLRMLVDDGLFRWLPPIEIDSHLLATILADAKPRPEVEVQVWGRLPLAWSARCFTARAADVGKDQCGMRCIEHPDGLPVATRDGIALLRINGIQIEGDEIVDLGPELMELKALGVDVLRIVPQVTNTADAVLRYRAALDTGQAPPRAGAINGYWHGSAGKPGVG